MTLAALELLVAVCAPNVAPATLLAIIATESGGVPYAVHVNGRSFTTPANRDQAVRLAKRAMNAGYSADLGLMQVNSRHLSTLGVSIDEVLDPCTNVRAGAAILAADYAAMRTHERSGERAVLYALSAYNTGDARQGFANGYVRRVLQMHRVLVRDKANRRRR